MAYRTEHKLGFFSQWCSFSALVIPQISNLINYWLAMEHFGILTLFVEVFFSFPIPILFELGVLVDVYYVGLPIEAPGRCVRTCLEVTLMYVSRQGMKMYNPLPWPLVAGRHRCLNLLLTEKFWRDIFKFSVFAFGVYRLAVKISSRRGHISSNPRFVGYNTLFCHLPVMYLKLASKQGWGLPRGLSQY